MLHRLKQLRKESSISQQKLAAQLNISQQSINKYENHDVEPDLALLMKMADYFHTTVDYLIGYSDIPARPLPAAEALSREESALISDYRSLSDDERRSILLIIRNYKKHAPAPDSRADC